MSWILLHKKLQEHRYWKERRKFSKAEAWIDILLSANYEDRDMVISGKSFVCKRGEVMYSMETWAKRWGWTKSQVRHFIASAREAHELRTVNNTVTTHLVVCKYESYQDGKHGKRTESARKAHGLRQQDKEVQEVQEVFKGNPQKVIHPIQTNYCLNENSRTTSMGLIMNDKSQNPYELSFLFIMENIK